MKEKCWKSIWDSKTIDKDIVINEDGFVLFCYLKKANGFDVNVKNEEKYYTSFLEAWDEFYDKVQEYANKKIRSVYEVGCGSGVNLYLFTQRNKNMKVGGVDYSQGLINVAKEIIETDDLTCGEARDIQPDTKYDLVMAESVFQYFDNIEYAEEVLRKMIGKSNVITYLGEMHDEDLRDEWLENRRKNMENYDQIYKGLDKQFYTRDWIKRIAEDYGKKVIFTDVDNKEFWNSRYVFNCYIF